MPRSLALALSLAALFALGAAAPLESTDAAGLKQALSLATERAVKLTSRPNGFLDNAKIRIGMPGALGKMTSGLRTIGMGAQVDELEVSMGTPPRRPPARRRPSSSTPFRR